MEVALFKTNYPSGSNPTVDENQLQVVHSESGGTTKKCKVYRSTSKPLKYKIKPKSRIQLITFNVNSLLKVGKLKNILNKTRERNIKIIAFQESRYKDEHTFDSEGYRIYKGKPGERVMPNCPHFGTGFIIDKSIIDSVTTFKSCSGRISTLTIKTANKIYTLINGHAPTNITNKKQPEIAEHFWNELDDTLQNFQKIT